MRINELAELPFEKLIETLRENGVSSFSCGSISLTLSQAPEKPVVGFQEVLKEETDNLPCGHASYFGTSEGFCLQGCKVEEKPTEN